MSGTVVSGRDAGPWGRVPDFCRNWLLPALTLQNNLHNSLLRGDRHRA